MEFNRERKFSDFALTVRLLGPLTIARNGVASALPSSRKVRALVAYLALAPRASTRSELCELLWDLPNDPRGELRWCLSKVRNLLDDSSRQRVRTSGEAVELDLSDCCVDALDIGRAAVDGFEGCARERLEEICGLFSGDLLDGLEIDSTLPFSGWLLAERRRFRGYHIALLENLASSASRGHMAYLERWLQLAPLDPRVHEIFLTALAKTGRTTEGDAHVAATSRLFEAEGLKSFTISDVWRSVKGNASPKIEPTLHTSDIATTMRRASVAVMPFANRAASGADPGGSAGALAHDVITRLAKLRSLFVIAQGTVFALQERCIGPQEAGRTLDVDYVVSGSVERRDRHFAVMVELAETRTSRIVWTEDFNGKLDDAFVVLDEIGNRIVASIASEIEANERNRAILKPPNSLDAWDAHHRGLWHMYRFNRADNDRAQHFFELAVRLDPTFSRAHAGLSFTHFQNAFQGWSEREPQSHRAFEAAGQSLMSDEQDPAAHWAMGRALWLSGLQDQSLEELERAVDLSPNFALAHYTLAFVHSQSGDPAAAIRSSDHSRHLSPFDPLLFGMLASRAMALVRLGQFEEAADWAAKAAARPNAHAHIRAIAACCLALADRPDEARNLVAVIHRTMPHYRIDDFFAAFRFHEDGAALFRNGAKRVGLA